jgi:hypothetical protein
MARTATVKAKAKPKVKQSVPGLVKEFVQVCAPLETEPFTFTDRCTNANYIECHIKASTLIAKGTTNVPLDPDDQGDYRANRELRLRSPAFIRMQDDAKRGRSFSNIVAEYTTTFNKRYPLKIIGGQHRFRAISDALSGSIDEYHGLKVYFGLDMLQRLDVQTISNTNIGISPDLIDRMLETVSGPQLRDWCQKAGLLPPDTEFTDHHYRGGPISVRLARSFITNYYDGTTINSSNFKEVSTTPRLCPTGVSDPAWDAFKVAHPTLWTDAKLLEAGKELALLVIAQRAAFVGKTDPKPKPDYPEKALQPAVCSAWAYVAGVLRDNPKRLHRHFELRTTTTGRDPLNAALLAKGRHRRDAKNYRGLGSRSDPRELARFAELFHLQAESGAGITKNVIDAAIQECETKVSALRAAQLRDKIAWQK